VDRGRGPEHAAGGPGVYVPTLARDVAARCLAAGPRKLPLAAITALSVAGVLFAVSVPAISASQHDSERALHICAGHRVAGTRAHTELWAWE